jgi:protein-S-isoprenylcysteine O-methyltransferase Ste14
VAAFIVQGFIRAPHAIRNRTNTIVDRRATLAERVLLPGMFLTMMVLPLVWIATPLLDSADYAAPIWVVALGGVMQMGFLWLFWRSHADLGRNWSPGLEVRDGHGLVTEGVYRHIRHPMYAAIWIGALAQPLLLHNWFAGPAYSAATRVSMTWRSERKASARRDRRNRCTNLCPHARRCARCARGVQGRASAQRRSGRGLHKRDQPRAPDLHAGGAMEFAACVGGSDVWVADRRACNRATATAENP